MGDDAALEAIRQRRLQELMAKHGYQGDPGGQMTPEAQQQQEEAQQQQEERRQSMLGQVLQPQARERLARIGLVKPEKARGVENLILQMAQRGQVTEKVSEERLIGLLEQIGQQAAGKGQTKVTIQRRRTAWDDDD
ncbi:g13263 [Coccomyxa viridis]|uniref:G13263 protein n=1 Tax=Coccomyxa viridis TaxID=1274662 RepID=A0ABP1GHV1_9CHLO